MFTSNKTTKQTSLMRSQAVFVLFTSLVCILFLGSCNGERYKMGMDQLPITTKNLTISPCTMTDVQDYYEHIYNSETVMEKFATGECRDKEYVKGRINGWVKRWEQKIPFSGLTVRALADQSFVGTMVLGGADEPCSSEIAYMIRHDKWGQRYGSEAIGALIQYADSLHSQKASLPNGEIFNRVIATCRQDNPRSSRILKRLDFDVYETSEKFGHTRDHYEYKMAKKPDTTLDAE